MTYDCRNEESYNTRINTIRGSEKMIFCEICNELGEQVNATSYCLDCLNPEPFCDSCAEDHANMRQTMDHRICSEINSYVLRESTKVPLSKEKLLDKATDLATENSGNESNNETKPGKPYVTGKVNRSDQILLKWESVSTLEDNDSYQIQYKLHPDGFWGIFQTQSPCRNPIHCVDGLKAQTSYVFKVRTVNGETGKEGLLSDESDVITTGESPAFTVMKRSEKIEDGPPAVYRLPIKEVVSARNETSQTRRFSIGSPEQTTTEKTIMIVGATGSGKSTLINAMANYVMGVTWEDSFRFSLIHLEQCEVERVGNEALSQTEWITCYTIHSNVSSRIDYTINLIDTPGFGDTRGLHQDAKIVSQLRDLFTSKTEKGIATLDAVCFILKAPDARLTTTQKYIFESILALFGKDIKDNICTLVTFADGQKPPVLSAIEALEDKPLPYKTYFSFNNSALFVENTENVKSSLSPFFWDLGMKSCKDFFQGLFKLQPKSLTMTADVLTKRQKLENTILHLQEEIDLGLSKINVLEQQVTIFTKFEREIRDNENFKYTVEERYLEVVDISGQGIYTTTCMICSFTCHNNCAYSDKKDKANCCAMSNGFCSVCPKHCHWTEHSNLPCVYKWLTKQVTKTYAETLDRYEQASKNKLLQEDVLKKMHGEIKVLEVAIAVKVEEVTDYTNSLKEIALRPDPLSTTQCIELMIESEKREKKSGFADRIATLEQYKKRAEIGKTVEFFSDRLRDTRASLKASKAEDNEPDSENESLAKKVKDKFRSLIYGD